MRRKRKVSWKKPVTSALKVAVSGGLLAWLLHRTHPGTIGHSLVSARPAWLVSGLLLGLAATLVQATQWQKLLRGVGLDRSVIRSLRIVFIGNTFNTVLPSSIGGDAARAVYVAEKPGERAPAAVAVVLQRLLNFPGMVVVMGLGLALTITSPAAVRARPVALAGAVIGLAILGVALSPLLGRLASSTSLARLPGWRALAASLRVLDGFRTRRAELAAAAGRGVVFWSLTVVNTWAYMRALGIHPSLAYGAVVVTLVNELTMLPISINGFGAREGGYTALLAGVGLATASRAASVGLLISAQGLLFGLIGAGCLVTLRRTPPSADGSEPRPGHHITSGGQAPSAPAELHRPPPEHAAASRADRPAQAGNNDDPRGPVADEKPTQPLPLHEVLMMRILMLAPEPVYSPRGTPISIINRCRALTALGHQVDLVTYPIGDDVPMPGLRFLRTPRLPGLRRVKVGPSLAKLPLDVLLFAVAAGRLCRRRYDVIHTHEEAGVAGLLLQAAFRLPHLHDVHDDPVNVLRDYGFGQRHPLVLLARWVEHRILTSAQALIVAFPQLATGMAQAPRPPVRVIHNAPLGHRVNPALSTGLRSRWGRDRPVVLYTGTLEPYQGIPLLLEAMQVVWRALPEARLVLVGGEPAQVAEVMRLAVSLGIAEAVICEGLRPAAEIPSYLAAADVLVSARRDGINTPLKVYAYLRAGKPIVATRTASHAQVLDDRCAVLTGLTPQAIAAGLLEVLRDPERSGQLSRAAAERAQDFGADSFVRQTAAAYQDLGGPAPSEQAIQKIVAALAEAA